MIEHSNSDDLICPYCEYQFSDSWELIPSGGWATIGCHECGKEFEYEANTQVTFNSWTNEGSEG